MRHSLGLLSLLLTLALGGPSLALTPEEPRPAPGWFVPLGFNLGVALGEGDAGFVFGGELSAVYLFGTSWAGLWGDLTYDFGVERARTSAGVEAGWFVFGVELGWVAERSPGGGLDHGLRLGAVVSGGFVATALRWSHLDRRGRGGSPDIVELSLLLKWPIPL